MAGAWGLLLLASSAAGQHWDYSTRGDTGPAHWSRLYKKCGGSRQSPVDLRPSQELETEALQLEHYSAPQAEAHLTNNGHTAKLATHSDNQAIPSLQGGGLPAKYYFSQVHFHWGSHDGQGSEHQVAGRTFPMEMHLVHYKASRANLTAALAEGAPDSLAVLGVLFQVGSEENPGLAELVPRLPEVRRAGAKITDAPLIPLSSLLHTADLSSFYRYEGSLTTPTCDQIVQWTVLKEPISISAAQLKAFRDLQDSHSHGLADNYRPVQSLGGRTVSSVTTGGAGSGSSSLRTATIPSLALLCLACLAM